MEVYRTEDGLVAKYVHDDGSETTIKQTSSCGNILNKATGKVEPVQVDRNKYSVFVSSSVGCPVGCKFCYLTVKKFPYVKLTCGQIAANVKEALNAEFVHNPGLRKKYMKLSFMGMGDALFLDPMEFRCMVKKLLASLIGDLGHASGLDGVDISTVLPTIVKGWPLQLGLLNDDLHNRYKLNPASGGRSIVRMFYSLHTPDLLRRSELIPVPWSAVRIVRELGHLPEVLRMFGVDFIVHHMFLEGQNDSDLSVRMLYNVMYNYFPDSELRILRYNECEGSQFKESKRFDELVKACADNLPNVKYQISAGSEIKAACGMFG